MSGSPDLAPPTRARETVAKICGLTRLEDARLAEAVGAAYLGAILASGPRLLDAARAAEVLGPRRAGIQRVGVFGAQSPAEIIHLVHRLDLDVAQLHGALSRGTVREIRDETGRDVWPVLRVDSTTLPEEAVGLADVAGWLVLDAKVVGKLGGTGVALDWAGLAHDVNALRDRVPRMRLVLAGGLRAGNVKQAIRLLAPDVADVSSGVELAPGVKDPDAVKRFVAAVAARTEQAE